MENTLTITHINDRIIEFTDSGADAYLILGDQKALLVDALMNRVGLVEAIQKETNLPVTAVITHGHGDHAGPEVLELQKAGIDVYMMPVDIDLLINMFGCSEEYRHAFTPLQDGELFDLGGICLQTIPVPGHTPGCVVFYEPDKRWLFSGDTVGSGSFWMQIPGCIPLHEFADNLDQLIARVGTGDDLKIYPGHRYQSKVQLTGQYLEDVRHLTRGILSGEIVGEPVSFQIGPNVRTGLAANYGMMQMGYCYNPDNL